MSHQSVGITRREWLRGAGLAALGAGLLQVAPGIAHAQISATTSRPHSKATSRKQPKEGGATPLSEKGLCRRGLPSVKEEPRTDNAKERPTHVVRCPATKEAE